MKYLIGCIVLALCLVGCEQKPKFSINESDTLETYTNNPAFVKVNTELNSDSYKFAHVPESVYEIKTGDLNVAGGYVFKVEYSRTLSPSVTLTIKGKASFDKLLERLFKLNLSRISDRGYDFTEKGYSYLWYLDKPDCKRILEIDYNPLSDYTTFSILNF